MFKSLNLSLIMEFILTFYWYKCVDWLLNRIPWGEGLQRREGWTRSTGTHRRPNGGSASSCPSSAHGHALTSRWLVGNMQRLKNKELGKPALREKQVNAPAEVSDSPWSRPSSLGTAAGPHASCGGLHPLPLSPAAAY